MNKRDRRPVTKKRKKPQGRRSATPDYNFAVCHPELAKEWHPTKNGDLRPEHLLPGVNKKFWWRCESNHTWQQRLDNRSRRLNTCPLCTGKTVSDDNRVTSLFPELLEDFDSRKNDGLSLKDFSYGSRRRVNWTCKQCAHEWQTHLSQRTLKKTGCPPVPDKLRQTTTICR